MLGAFDGKAWRRLEVQPTKTSAGDTPGVSNLTTPMNAKPGVLSFDQLARKMTCAGGGPLTCTSDPPAGAKRALLAAAKGHEADVEHVGTLAHGKGALAFVVMQGDSLHAMSPAVLCKDAAAACKDSVVVEARGASRQLSFAADAGFALIGDEYSGANATVIDAAGKVVLKLPTATAAALLPAGVKLE